MTKIHDIESLKKELNEKQAELKKIQSNIDKYYYEQILSKDIIKKFKIEKISKINFIPNYAPSITTGKDSFLNNNNFYNINKDFFLFFTKKEIPNQKYYYEIICNDTNIFDYDYDDYDDDDDPTFINIGLAKYTLLKDKKVYLIKNERIIQDYILRTLLLNNCNAFSFTYFLNKYIKDNSEKINLLNKINKLDDKYNTDYSMIIFNEPFYKDEDFEHPEQFKIILKKSIVDFINNKIISIMNIVNKKLIPFNVDFHMMIS